MLFGIVLGVKGDCGWVGGEYMLDGGIEIFVVFVLWVLFFFLVLWVLKKKLSGDFFCVILVFMIFCWGVEVLVLVVGGEGFELMWLVFLILGEFKVLVVRKLGIGREVGVGDVWNVVLVYVVGRFVVFVGVDLGGELWLCLVGIGDVEGFDFGCGLLFVVWFLGLLDWLGCVCDDEMGVGLFDIDFCGVSGMLRLIGVYVLLGILFFEV